MIQKPSLLQSVADDLEQERQIQSQHTSSQRRPLQHCTCPALFKHTPDSHSRSYNNKRKLMPARCNMATFSSTLTHRRDCILSRESQETKQFGVRISFSGPLLQGAIQAAMSMTRGSGGFSFSPVLAFNYVVRSDTVPFGILGISYGSIMLSPANALVRLDSQKRELMRLYDGGNASPHDVDENGNTILHVSP